MKFLILVLFSPAVFCAQRYRKSTNPNDEPFLPIHPDYPYNPKLMKRGIEQQPAPNLSAQSQAQSLAQLTPELYAPKVDARDSYTASYAQSPYYSSFDPYKTSATTSSLTASSPYLSAYTSAYNANPYGLLNSYGSPYAASAPGYGATAPGPYGAAVPGSYGASPYAATSAYPNYSPYYQPPYYYPNYYNQPPYPPPPPGYPGLAPYGKPKDDEDDEEEDKRKGKNKKSGSGKSRFRDSERDAADNQYVDGGNYIISSSKDLDGESSTHRTPTTYNHIEDSNVHPRTVVLPKATYRLVSVSGQQQGSEYSSPPAGYIKIQQLEQLMRQALAKLLAQNAAQQANLAQIQEAAAAAVQQQSKDNQQYLPVPNTIAKAGLSYVVNPTILNRVNPGQYNPSQLINTQALLGGGGGSSSSSKPKSVTNVSLQQSPGIYIPPTKSEPSPLPEYGDYDSDGSTTRSQSSISNYQPTVEPTRNYPYSTYRPTQQTSLDDVNFGSKQNTKS